MQRINLLILVLMALSIAFGGQQLEAKIIKYVDENGTIVFVDDQTKVPKKFTDQLTTYEEAHDKLTPEQRKQYFETRRQEQEFADQQAQRAEQARAEQARESARQTRVEIRNRQVIVPVEVAHANRVAHLKLLVDTGASSTVVHLDAMTKFNFKKAELGFAQVAGGYIIPMANVQLLYFKVGPKTENGMKINIIDNQRPNPRFDGLLGMDFLMKHKYRIDYEREMLIWE